MELGNSDRLYSRSVKLYDKWIRPREVILP
nr:MAG TPA: hypothetical protein [Caudoviricetes sp.]